MLFQFLHASTGNGDVEFTEVKHVQTMHTHDVPSCLEKI